MPASTPLGHGTRTGLVLTEEFEDALHHLESGANVLLTGKAGTGKSTLIRHFMERTARNVVVVAPTGIAALNVGGYTVHRLFSLHAGLTLEDIERGAHRPGRFAGTLKTLDTLIVDEASMVRADLFDTMAAVLRQHGPKPGEPFGGVQIVLVGDLYQLPPVVNEAEKAYFRSVYETEYFFSARAYRPEAFHAVQLTHIFRQQGDPRLVEILNDVREGILLDDARAELNRLARPDFEPPEDEFWLTLTTTNRSATLRNHRELDRLPGAEHVSVAEISGDLTGFEAPTDAHLALKPGAQVMMLTNDDAGRWVNGTMAHVVRLRRDSWDAIVTVRLPDGTSCDVFPHTWDVTTPTASGRSLVHQVIGSFRQLPLRLAWAVTIHKSQGQTLDRVIVDLTGGTFADGQLYVALSRCTSLDGLVLRRAVGPKDLKVDQRVRRFLHRAVPSEPRSHVYLAIRTVGDEGARWRPRPVEIGMVDDDGCAVSTLINPDRDMGDARTRLGITPREVQLAPVLADAWGALEPLLAGKTPVGRDIDTLLGYIDYELKRTGHVARIPLGISLSGPSGRTGDRASGFSDILDEARALRDEFLEQVSGRGPTVQGRPEEQSRSEEQDGPVEQGQPFPAPSGRVGYLWPRGATEGDILLPSGPEMRQDAAALIAAACGRSRLDDAQRAVVHGIEKRFEVTILGDGESETPDPWEVLAPGARVCFTGSAYDAEGRALERGELELLALNAGLRPVLTVTKTRCDVLVSAESGTQSNKAKNAMRFGKPVLTVEEFLAWEAIRSAELAQGQNDEQRVQQDDHRSAQA